jgi:hypothetical protein
MQLPDDSSRHVLIGRTGSGKTQAAVHALSLRDYRTMPWFVLNFKEDELINSIPLVVHLDGLTPPEAPAPGIYVAHPDPDDYEGMEDFFRWAWLRRDTGIYVDEAYMVAKPGWHSKWFRRILTQGRSLRVPVIVCTQQPAWIDSFVFSEADFFQCFSLSIPDHIDRVQKFTSPALDPHKIPDYWSYWYDVKRDALSILRPVPDRAQILASFAPPPEPLAAPAPEKRDYFL